MQAVLEPRRLKVLEDSALLDSEPEEQFDRITRIASRLIGTPTALVSLVDRGRQFFKSAVGLGEPWASARETPLSHSFCKHVVATSQPLVVQDARDDPVLKSNPAVSELGVISYLGVPLNSAGGDTLGSFCVMDRKPREWSEQDIGLVRDLAAIAMERIELRLLAARLRDSYLDMRQLEMQREEMTQMIVHDLRNPLTSLLGGLDAVRSLKGLGEQQAKFLQIAQKSGEALLQIVGTILDVGQAEAGRLQLQRARVAPAALATSACEQLAQLASARQVDLRVETENGLPEIFADGDRLRRVLVNLTANAIQHSPRDAIVQLRVSRQPDVPSMLLFSVVDAGCGIPREAFERIFEKYANIATSQRRRTSTGLGLPFSRMVVEAHGGSIWVESEIGQGTAFRFTLPWDAS